MFPSLESTEEELVSGSGDHSRETDTVPVYHLSGSPHRAARSRRRWSRRPRAGRHSRSLKVGPIRRSRDLRCRATLPHPGQVISPRKTQKKTRRSRTSPIGTSRRPGAKPALTSRNSATQAELVHAARGHPRLLEPFGCQVDGTPRCCPGVRIQPHATCFGTASAAAPSGSDPASDFDAAEAGDDWTPYQG